MAMSRIRVLGGGIYGCHIATTLIAQGHVVEVHEIADRLFAGASGANPARLHLGFHYPRSLSTRALSQANYKRFMKVYGAYTRGIAVNLYAVAEDESLVDFEQYRAALRGEVEYVTVANPAEFGLAHVEGAVLTAERHVLIDRLAQYFAQALRDRTYFGCSHEMARAGDDDWDYTVDCTFSALDRAGIHRYEPCVTFLYGGSWDKAVTVMDGPLPSMYPHYAQDSSGGAVVSLTSAKYTPLAKVKTWEEAQAVLTDLTEGDLKRQRTALEEQISYYYPEFRDQYQYGEARLAVRAMPISASDARLPGVEMHGRRITVRAGKIDAIFDAGDRVMELVNG